MVMPGRSYTAASADGYRFGYNGMHKDDEIKGNNNSLDFGARVYDSRIGRWLSIDPLLMNFPDLSPYIGIGNNPILYYDPDGRKIRVSSDYTFGLFRNRLGEVFKSKDIAETIFHINLVYDPAAQANFGMIETKGLTGSANGSSYKNLNFKDFRSTIDGLAKFWEVDKFSKKEAKLAYRYYKMIDSEQTREILVTGANHINDNENYDINSGDITDTQRLLLSTDLHTVYTQNGTIEENNNNGDGTYNTENIISEKTKNLSDLTGNDGIIKYPLDTNNNDAVLIDDTNQSEPSLDSLIDQAVE